MDYIISIYNKLDESSPYRSDIFDLFGTQDGLISGVIGTKKGDRFQSLNWDWGLNGIKKVCKFLYWHNNNTLKEFDTWYQTVKDLDYKCLNSLLTKLLYVFKYKTNRISAFIASVDSIEKRENSRLWFTFTPDKFVLLPSEFMEDYRNIFFTKGREDFCKWQKYLENHGDRRNIQDDLRNIFSSAMAQDQYHIIPVTFIEEWVENKTTPPVKTKPIFITSISDNLKLKNKRLRTNNEIFWSVFSQYTGRAQVKGSFIIVDKGKDYKITDISANTFSEKNSVYFQEVGTAYVIYQVLADIFQIMSQDKSSPNQFISTEFSNNNELPIYKSKFIGRAERVADIAKIYRKDFGKTNYDYVLRLDGLGISRSIVFDLTCGLWDKGLWKPKEEFIKQWFHNIIEVPLKNSEIIAVWHYGHNIYQSYKGKEVGKYLIEESKLKTNQYFYLNKECKTTIQKETKIIFLPFYNDNKDYNKLDVELKQLDPSLDKCRSSWLYKVCKDLVTTLINNSL